MTTTYSNRGYALQGTGDNVNAWGPVLNANFSSIDQNISGNYSITSTGGTVTLSTSNAANVFFAANGALTSNLMVVFPLVKTFFMFQNSTSGSYTVTVSAAGAGAVVSPVQGEAILCYCDGTNVTICSNTTVAVAPVIPSGTVMNFLQSTAPTGWTQSTSFNDSVIRLVNDSSGGTTGGSWTISGTTISGTALTISQIPPYSFPQDVLVEVGSGGNSNIVSGSQVLGKTLTLPGGGLTHTHTFSNDATWRPAYVNSLVAVKN
jgi:hypothetical protein